MMFRLTCITPRIDAVHRRKYSRKTPKPETHYEVLNVNSDCSTRDIRNAFVKLSKQFHPDVRSDATNVEKTNRFVQISEAYRILVKPQSRRVYDDSLLWTPTGGARSQATESDQTYQAWEVRPNYSPNPGAYYGIKGMKRVSNWQVALFLIALGVFGAIFGFTSVKQSFELSRQLQEEISADASSHHAAVVADAQKYGNEEQMRRMIHRISKGPFNQSESK
ncbi:uncharacterized protein Dwil_GK23194 [Drosophila willistoni]|uniref:J domain-containing protein n=1 Tax=Drosophila willistoni TaxID=7260 RepID=B4NMS0_DROWI|nr:dnaJ-like protein 60 [Drosophila willistoni]EDW85659.2 uncharacterized protein Dwil_GK23194 [Drosophila willistoni]